MAIKESYSDHLNIPYMQSLKVRSQAIYLSVLLFMLLVSAALPLIKIQVSEIKGRVVERTAYQILCSHLNNWLDTDVPGKGKGL
jgi:hypothetical protein